jgi:hypothetical protein
VSACGSTAQRLPGAATQDGLVPVADSPQQAGLGGELGGGSSGAPVVTTQPGGTGGSVTGNAPTGSDGVPLPAGDGGGTSGGTTLATNGPGVTGSTIYFGATYAKNQQTANSGVTGANIDSGDSRNYYNALVDEINKAGGILGHRVAPIYFGVDPTSTQTVEQQSQAACSYWTEDHKVFAILGAGQELMRRCATSAGVLQLETSGSTATARVYRQHPNYVEISALSLDRAGRSTVEGLARTDYLKGAPKIGLITWDDPDYITGFKGSWLPALARQGISGDKVLVQYATPPQSYNGLSDSAASVSNAILKFRQAGIDHVIIADGPAGIFGNTGLTLLFIKDASSQKYLPRYGMNSSNSPQGGIDAGLWTAQDVPGSVAVEWQGHPADPKSAVTAHCLDLMRKAGVTMDNINAEEAAAIACDQMYFLRAALLHGPGAITVPAALRGVDQLASSYASPLTFGTFFGPGRRDGVSKARLSILHDDCGCYRWQGGLFSLS